MHQMIWMIQKILGFHIIIQILPNAPDDSNNPEDFRFPYIIIQILPSAPYDLNDPEDFRFPYNYPDPPKCTRWFEWSRRF